MNRDRGNYWPIIALTTVSYYVLTCANWVFMVTITTVYVAHITKKVYRLFKETLSKPGIGAVRPKLTYK